MKGEQAQVTISVGGGCYEPDEGLKAFVKRIDDNMYRAKNCGKNRVIFA